MEEGFITLPRSCSDFDFYPRKRVFTDFEAWIDLVFQARFSREPVVCRDKKGEFELCFGDVEASLRYLGERWKWSPNKVDRWIKTLKDAGELNICFRNSNRTILRIVNMGIYTGERNSKRNSNGTATEQQRNKEEKGKKGKRGKGNPDDNPDFVKFWMEYPKRVNKNSAFDVFCSLNPDELLLAAMLKSIEDFRKTEDWIKDGGKFIPYPAKWLKEKKWQEDTAKIDLSAEDKKIGIEDFKKMVSKGKSFYGPETTPGASTEIMQRAISTFGWAALHGASDSQLFEFFEQLKRNP